MKIRTKHRILVCIPFGFMLFSVAIVLLYRWVPVKYTLFMFKREIQFKNDDKYHRTQKYVRLDAISPELIKAVIIAEDQKFYYHPGFDFNEMRAMWKEHKLNGAPIRGCSTISQQTAKNVFTFGSQTIVRKTMEAYWTILIEILWGKDRIMECYLNNAEMGIGIYGIGAASMIYYNKEPSQLDIDEVLTIVACLPNPLVDQPGKLTISARNRKRHLARKMITAIN